MPAEKAAQLVVQVASGPADALSGCFFGISDELEKLLERLEEIKRADLYTLRIREL